MLEKIFKVREMKIIKVFIVALCLLTFTLFPQLAFAQGRNYYDVIVVGGEPEGITAALSASRNEAKTLLLTEDRALGGTITLADLNVLDMNHGPRGQLLTKGIFEEFLYLVGGESFSVGRARKAFSYLTSAENNLTIRLETKIEKPIFAEDGKTLIGLEINKNGKNEIIYGRRFVDATADADLAVLAGVPYTVGQEDWGRGKVTMASTLVFQVKGVKWDVVRNYLREDNNINTSSTNVSAWGYGNIMKNYIPLSSQIKLRGLNIGREDDNSVMINALLIFGVNPLDKSSVKNGYNLAKKEIERVVEYLRKEAPGFENASLEGCAEKLYIRESRHIDGEYKLTIDDVLNNRNFEDKVALGSYPVDIQAAYKHENGIVIGVPEQYSIPFRCLVPIKVENLLVVGRSASYTSLAAGSARVIPVGMVEGQSAGYAAVYSLRKNLTFRQLSKNKEDFKQMQENLRAQGVYLPEFKITTKQASSLLYTSLESLRRKGLVAGGYNNDYHLNETIKPLIFMNMFRCLLSRLPDNLKTKKSVQELVPDSYEDITYGQALKILNEGYRNHLFSNRLEKSSNFAVPKEIEERILTELKRSKREVLNKGEAIILMAQFLKQVE